MLRELLLRERKDPLFSIHFMGLGFNSVVEEKSFMCLGCLRPVTCEVSSKTFVFTFLLDLRPSSFLHLKVVTIVSPRRIFNCLWNLMIPLPPSSCSVLLLLLLLAPPTPISDHGTREVVATLETRTWISSYCETLPRYTVTSTKYVWGLGYAPSYDKFTAHICHNIHNRQWCTF